MVSDDKKSLPLHPFEVKILGAYLLIGEVRTAYPNPESITCKAALTGEVALGPYGSQQPIATKVVQIPFDNQAVSLEQGYNSRDPGSTKLVKFGCW